jgi:DNA-binding transcriptional ArsR family regulator
MNDEKAGDFHPDLIRLADLSKALGHPGRLEILRILADGSCVCGDIVDRMPFSQSTVSQHLKELKRVGLIRGETEGTRICYCLNPDTVAAVREDFARLFQDFQCCGTEGESNEECR